MIALRLALASAPGEMVTLNDGHSMPSISLGTCCGSDVTVGLPAWVAAGGIGVDTSIDYGEDEPKIAALMAKGGIPRSRLYLTTKVTAGCGGVADCGADPAIALRSVNASLSRLGVEYLDLVLLHRPCQQLKQHCSIAPKLSNCTGPTPLSPADSTAANAALWRGLMAAKAAGLVRSIGVSNYDRDQLAALPGDVPAVNQCEMSVEGHDDATLAYCASKGIRYESYGAMRGCPFTDPKALAIAKQHGVSVAQVCLRWTLQRGAVIATGTGSDPKTAGTYAKENLAVFGFSLSEAEVQTLDTMMQ